MSPYRLPTLRTDDARPPRFDGAFAWLGSIVWVGSCARVVLSAVRRAPLDQEVLLAVVLVIALPYAMARAFIKS